MIKLFVSALVVVAVATACQKKQDTPAPPAPAQTGMAEQPSGLPEGHPPVRSLPEGHPPTTVPSELPPMPSGEIAGRIEASAKVAAKIKAGDSIFLMARNGATNGIIAVAKLAAPEKFPLEFKLTGANVMLPGGSLAGKVKLMARVDKDGDAISKNPGDVVGEVKELVQVPADKVVLTLDQVL